MNGSQGTYVPSVQDPERSSKCSRAAALVRPKAAHKREKKGSVVLGWRALRPPRVCRVVFVIAVASLINLSLQAKNTSFKHQARLVRRYYLYCISFSVAPERYVNQLEFFRRGG